MELTKACNHCGKTLERKRSPSGTLEGAGCFARRKYCDRSCMAESMKKDRPTRSAIQKRLASQRKGCCENCGASESLSIHHKDRDWMNNDTSNLMTLCSSCHTSLHHKAGDIVMTKEPTPCTVCGKRSYRLGLCCTHLTRFKRYGNPCLVRKRIGASWLLVQDHGSLSGQE